MSRQTTRWPRSSRPKRCRSLRRWVFSITAIALAQATSAPVSGVSASWLNPAEATSSP